MEAEVVEKLLVCFSLFLSNGLSKLGEEGERKGNEHRTLKNYSISIASRAELGFSLTSM